MDKNVREMAELIAQATADGTGYTSKDLANVLTKAGYIKPSPSENSHLETEGELVQIRNESACKLCALLFPMPCESQGDYEPNDKYAPGCCNVQKHVDDIITPILSKLSPHLARLEGENERLKKMYDELQYANESLFSKAELDDAVSQAVREERDRIGNILRSKYSNVSKTASKTAAYQIAKDLCIDLDWQALQK